jgi:autotransporter-associated beta strand protein
VSANNGQGAAVGPGLFIVSGATVNFAPGDGVTMTFSEVIADDSPSSIGTGTWNAGTGGGGSITMQGPGTLVITGNNTYTGTTYITGGRLNVISSIPIGSAGVFVSAGGTLGGTGTVYGGGTIKGTLSPGTSVGVLTLDTSAANVTLGSTAVTNIDLSPAAASKVVITGSGSIALDGTVNASPSAGNYGKSGSYPILEGTYKGTFNPNVTGGMNGYLFSLAYDTNLVNLLYEFVYLIPTEDLYHNELSVANYLNKAFEEGYLPASAIELFINLDHSDLKHAMDSISPARNAFANYITQQVALSLSDLVTKHLDGFRMEQTASLIDTSKKCKPGRCGCKNKTSKWKLKRCACKNTPSKSAFSGWLSGFGKYAHQGAEKQNPAFNFWSDAILGGFDYHLDTNNLVGTSIGYAGSYFSEAHQKTHGHINYYFANLYGNAYVDNLYFSPSIWGIFNDTQNIRKIAFPGYAAKAEAKICAWQLVPHLEVGYNLKYKWGSLTPFTSVDWAITWQRKYEEQGAIFFNARSKAKSNSILRSETGVKRFERWDNCWGSFFLQEKIAYVFETLFGTDDVATALTGIPIDFTTKALQKNLNLADIAIDFAVAFGKKKSTTLSLGYEGQVGPHYWSNQVVLALNKMF